ncbi:XIAP-associated factor 1 isoform X1 [Microtus oregoni]|uniref:XIAP-associated factor 1 isoform X1 n=2 Tax=Microtus oregoni TaxID=111838 RepID=UPI001BB166A2|nr:XIAP-associated factor 1 isoform X1 [Microtus oregoni]
MEADSQVCQNCKRNVASAHCTLHGAHCLSFLVVCPECEEPVPRSKMKEHVDTVHQQAKKIQQHPGQCKFCDLAVHFNKLDVHEFHCGSRTERCPHCNQPIVLRVLAQHKAVCLRAKAKPEEGKGNVSPGRTQCDSCKQMIPENKYVSHMKQCPASKTVTYLQDGKPKILPPSLTSQVTGNQTSSAKKDVRPKTKTRNSARKQKTKDQNGTVDLPLKSAVQQRAALPTGDEAAAYDILRRCRQCGILLPLPILNLHQEKCLRLAHQKKNN